MDDFEIWLEQSRARDELKREKYFKMVADTIRDGSLILEGMSLKVAQRFEIDIREVEYSPCWRIADHYICNDSIEMGFSDWLYSNQAPFICHLSEIGKFFPEFVEIASSDKEIVKLANSVYGLELQHDDDWYNRYVYAFSLDFESFVPIDYAKVNELKEEIRFCIKYGLDYSHLAEEIEGLGLEVENVMEV